MYTRKLSNTKVIKLADIAVELTELEEAINKLADRLYWIERDAEAEYQVHSQARFLRKEYVADLTYKMCNIISYVQAQEKILKDMQKKGLK